MDAASWQGRGGPHNDDSYRHREYHRPEHHRRDDDYGSSRRRQEDYRGGGNDRQDDYRRRDDRDRYDSYYGRSDARREAESRVSREGLLCDDDRGGFGARRSGTRDAPRERRERRGPRRSGWDDRGGASEQDIAAAQAQHAAVTQMYVHSNPMMGMAAGMGPLQVNGRKQRELYVGNLQVGVVTADMLKDFLTNILTQCPGYSPKMGPPVAVVQMNAEGKFAFVEFRDECIAVTALQLDKLDLAGRPLNVGRPAGYQPAPGQPLPTPLPMPSGVRGGSGGAQTVDPQAAAAVAGLLGGNGPSGAAPLAPGMAVGYVPPSIPNNANQIRKQRELYVGNLAVGVVTASHLRELFRAPLLTMANLASEEEGGPLVLNVDLSADGKFAFVEFREDQIATIALQLFDKMEVCGRNLNVGRPRGYIDPGPGGPTLSGPALGSAVGMPAPPSMGLPSLGLPAAPSASLPLPPSVGLSVVPPTPLPPPPSLAVGLPVAPLPGVPPSRYLKLKGMLTPEMIADDVEYAELVEDIRQECESVSAGKVLEFLMPRAGPLACLCLVAFDEVGACAKARDALDGRPFDGKAVQAIFMDEAEWTSSHTSE